MFYAELAKMVAELSVIAFEARLEKITDADDKIQLILKARGAGKALYLILDWAPRHQDFYCRDKALPSPSQPKSFTMLLRKYLQGQSLAGLRLASDDRVLCFEFGPTTAPRRALYLEFRAHQSNLFLIDLADQKILGQLYADPKRWVGGDYRPAEPKMGLNLARSRYPELSRPAFCRSLSQELQARDEQEFFDWRQRLILQGFQKERRRLERRLAALGADATKAQAVRAKAFEADLLAAYLHTLKRGLTEVSLASFEDPKRLHRIELDPARSPRENLDARYKALRRARRAEGVIQEQRQLCLLTLERLALFQAKFESLRDVQAQERALEALKVSNLAPKMEESFRALQQASKSVRPEVLQTAPKVLANEKLPYRSFYSQSGLEIRVGKSARDNDALTFQYSKGKHHWLHAYQVPGSHVTICSDKPDPDCILDAACLALHYSKLAKAITAEVQHSQVKYVQKCKKAAAGQVQVRWAKTLTIEKDPKRIERLLARGGEA